MTWTPIDLFSALSASFSVFPRKIAINMETNELSEKSRLILEAVAEGYSYEQILSCKLAATYHDIFRAAAEALDITDRVKHGRSYEERIAEIRAAYPRAYEKWTEEEDNRLTQFFHDRASIKQLAQTFERQPNAIRSRLARLNLALNIQKIAGGAQTPSLPGGSR